MTRVALQSFLFVIAALFLYEAKACPKKLTSCCKGSGKGLSVPSSVCPKKRIYCVSSCASEDKPNLAPGMIEERAIGVKTRRVACTTCHTVNSHPIDSDKVGDQ